jgi:hypothetical protein
MIDVTLTHVDAVLDRLAMLGPKAGDALATVSQEIAGRLRDAADRNLSGGVLEQRTGKLRASLLAGVERGEGGLHGTVTATAPYAAFQEYGFSGAAFDELSPTIPELQSAVSAVAVLSGLERSAPPKGEAEAASPSGGVISTG